MTSYLRFRVRPQFVSQIIHHPNITNNLSLKYCINMKSSSVIHTTNNHHQWRCIIWNPLLKFEYNNHIPYFTGWNLDITMIHLELQYHPKDKWQIVLFNNLFLEKNATLKRLQFCVFFYKMIILDPKCINLSWCCIFCWCQSNYVLLGVIIIAFIKPTKLRIKYLRLDIVWHICEYLRLDICWMLLIISKLNVYSSI
jgi:hypothetical protein